MTDTPTGLPASIEVAWGLRDRAQKGPRPALTLARVVAAGVAVARAEGIGAVSMSRVAKELGAATMSLYRYVSAKHELVDLMVDAVYGDPPPIAPDEDWRSGLDRWAWAVVEIYQRDPWTVQVPVSGPPITPNAVAWADNALQRLAGTGLEPGEKLAVVLLVANLVRGEMILALQLAEVSRGPAAGNMVDYGGRLSRLIDERRFPAMSEVVASGVFDGPGGEHDELRFALDRVLDGIEVLIHSRTS
ncbi:MULTISPECIES: TetR/AcrR family transcriptional regulator C-terminal domain-containing protein [unclassified Solwaraspora]|uniref:TetR/AcrR family transcriptional regulator C-terminal domain-containing protein n=1 Tax=unclassified Solwaraspora TaxID=2627926 RepID=UPI00259B5333|nr:TetR/AcrR family transcriptional regulator C-terminal domain-containing protein [Solwaraspora sp. WMMA2056]WJK42062.1 TetR/AcrR family transcriptional regulator C-terminal domain-containing protein [Solwaraspora sp. WMMA2056]